jgi:hypothetical protein
MKQSQFFEEVQYGLPLAKLTKRKRRLKLIKLSMKQKGKGLSNSPYEGQTRTQKTVDQFS